MPPPAPGGPPKGTGASSGAPPKSLGVSSLGGPPPKGLGASSVGGPPKSLGGPRDKGGPPGPPILRSHGAELQVVFKCIDNDGDGVVSLSDMLYFINSVLQQKKDEKEVLLLLEEVIGGGAPQIQRDARGAPLLTFSSFLSFIDRQLREPAEDKLKPIFTLLAGDKQNKICAADLNLFCSRVGIPLGLDGASQLLQIAAGAPADAADFNLFCTLFKKCMPTPLS